MLKVAPCTDARTHISPNFFGLMGTTISYNYGATLRALLLRKLQHGFKWVLISFCRMFQYSYQYKDNLAFQDVTLQFFFHQRLAHNAYMRRLHEGHRHELSVV